jgi:uncharacterized protein (TIGR03085 family)
MTSFAAQERQALVDALLLAGPSAPTLCEGWTAHDLAAHLVSRERRPDSGLGLMVPLLAGHTEKVRRSYLEQPFTDLVELVRTGPPRLSMFALPWVDELANLSEYFVHCEDVRRAAPGWEPRELPLDLQEALWGALARMAKLALRRSTDPVRLVRPDGAEISSGPAGQPVRVHGEVSELLLYLFGRTSVAQVRIEGDEAAVSRFRALRMGV